MRWYYDLSTDQLFTGPMGMVVPCEVPSGSDYEGKPAGVYASVYKCDCESDEEPRIILGRFELNSRRLAGYLRVLPSDEWVRDKGNLINQIVREFQQECEPGHRFQQCLPQTPRMPHNDTTADNL